MYVYNIVCTCVCTNFYDYIHVSINMHKSSKPHPVLAMCNGHGGSTSRGMAVPVEHNLWVHFGKLSTAPKLFSPIAIFSHSTSAQLSTGHSLTLFQSSPTTPGS